MVHDPHMSPAARSMELEKARQARQRDDLEGALKDTFPASDPVSQTFTAIPAGRTDTEEAERVRKATQTYGDADECAKGFADDLRDRVRARPLTALALTAAAAWLWGISR